MASPGQILPLSGCDRRHPERTGGFRVPVDDPAVSQILGMLAPVVHEELSRCDEDGPDAPGDEWALFQELNAPLFMVAATP